MSPGVVAIALQRNVFIVACHIPCQTHANNVPDIMTVNIWGQSEIRASQTATQCPASTCPCPQLPDDARWPFVFAAAPADSVTESDAESVPACH